MNGQRWRRPSVLTWLGAMLLPAMVPTSLRAEYTTPTLYQVSFGQTDGGYVLEDPDQLWHYGLQTSANAPGFNVGQGWLTGDGSYINGANASLLSPEDTPLDLGSVDSATLVLVNAYAFEPLRSECLTSAPPSFCGDGGQLLLVYPDGQEELIVPSVGYPGTIQVNGLAEPAFTGSTVDLPEAGVAGIVTHYFDLDDHTVDGLRLKLRFASDFQTVDAGWFVQEISILEGDRVPPIVTLDSCPPAELYDVGGPYEVSVRATDNHGIRQVSLTYAIDGGQGQQISMTSGSGDLYTGLIPGIGLNEQVANTGSIIEYWVTAEDVEGNVGNLLTTGGIPLSFRVSLPAPGQLVADDVDTVEADTIHLSWTEAPPAAGAEICGYRILHDGEDAFTAEIISSTQDVKGGALEAEVLPFGYPFVDRFRVCALFSESCKSGQTPLCGLSSNQLDFSVLVPRLLALTPNQAFPGQSSRVAVDASSTFFAQDEVSATLGEGVTVLAVDVIDVQRLELEVAVASDATPGPRDLLITSSVGPLVLEGGFEVLDPALQPRIVSLEPAEMEAGNTIQVLLTVQNLSLTDQTLELSFGSGIAVLDQTLLSDTELEVTIQAAVWAAGERQVSMLVGTDSYDTAFAVLRSGTEVQTCGYVQRQRQPPPGAFWPLVLLGALAAKLKTRVRRGDVDREGEAPEACETQRRDRTQP